MPEQPKTQSPVNKAGAAQSPKSANNNKKQASQQPQQAAPAASTPTSPSGNVWSQRQQQAEQQQQQQQPAAQSQPEQQQEGQKQKSQRPRRPRQPKKNQQVRAPQNEGQQDQQQQGQSADNAAPKQPRQRKPRQPRRQPQQSVQQLPPFVFVKGLTPAVDGDKLKTIFEQNGHPVKAARVIVDKRTNTSRGYGFVEFETQDQANAALKMDNTQVEGQAIHVELGGGAPRVSAPRAAPTAANNQNNHNQQRTGGKRRGAPRAPAAGADATTGAQQQQQQRRGRGRGRGGRRPATTNAQLPEEKDFPVHSAGPFVDIGANLTKKTWFASDLNDVLQRASNNGVSAIIITGTSVAASKEAIEIAKTRQTGTTKLFATVGVHPHDAKTFDANTTINELEQLITSNPDVVVAIGECGLDFNRNYSEPAAQLTCFEEQIKLAIKLNKPMFLHERDSQPQFMELLNKYKSQLGNGKDRSGPLVCVHCFTGSSALLDELLEFGAYIGVTAVITEATTKRGTELRENIKRVPLDRLMIETDAPFHLPRNVKFAYSRNEPANIKYVANALSTILGVSEQEIAKKTTENAIKFFGLTGI